MDKASNRQQKDWVGNPRGYMVAWGLPIAALIVAVFLPPLARTIVGTAALLWMGMACLANAARCGRTHCYFTGPFFLVLAAAVALHGFGILWLGPNGWIWLGTAIVVGSVILWWLPERVFGKFARSFRD
ncbi:MAG: hypothetical protein J4G10_01855 [Alphaproteobacteria bacterium]|nr:hypothetical protein [Alphaproteobacteria bacterium]